MPQTLYYWINPDTNYPVLLGPDPLDYQDAVAYTEGQEPIALSDALALEEQNRLTVLALIEATKLRDANMLTGFIYNGKQISVTKDDGDGMVQVETSFNKLKQAVTAGILPIDTIIQTTIKFKNGTELPIGYDEFQSFSLLFLIERNKFFV